MAKFSMTKQKFVNQWLRHFAPDITKQQFKEYIENQFLWHVFSWKLVQYEGLLIGDEARAAYDAIDKTNCICCDRYGQDGVKDHLPARYDTAEKIDKCTTELYVVANDYSWTYIKTHEGDLCGPYFLKI